MVNAEMRTGGHIHLGSLRYIQRWRGRMRIIEYPDFTAKLSGAYGDSALPIEF
ncbi:hypothetical protein GGD62_008303 [Bradyrhizobium sp. ERR14]|nr:hypothetical protein [Bradyrhizobium sp. ERR14]